MSFEQIELTDCRPVAWPNEENPSLPLPPSGKLRQIYKAYSGPVGTFVDGPSTLEEFEQKKATDKIIWQCGFDDAMANREKYLDAKGRAPVYYHEGYVAGREKRATENAGR